MRIKHELLRNLRLNRGWRQIDAAEAVRIDERTYRRYESGQVNRGPSTTNFSKQYEILRDLAATYGLSGPEDLLDPEPTRLAGGDAGAEPIASGRQLDCLQPADAPYHQAWYVHREAEERRALNRLRGAGAPVVLQGPQLYGKSMLLGYLLESMRSASPQQLGVRLNLAAIERSQLSSLDGLLRCIGQSLIDDGGFAASLLATAWQRPGSAIQKLVWLLEQCLAERDLVLALEKADVVHGFAYHADFFAMLRGWSERGNKPPWSRLRLIVTISTEPSLLESIDHSSFFVLANPIRIDDLTPGQVADLGRMYGMAPTASEIGQLVDLVGGGPYLVRLAFYECILGEYPLAHLLTVADRGVFIPHLLRLRGWLQAQGLIAVVQKILQRPNAEIPFEQYCSLYAKGLFKETSTGVYHLRSRLYEEYFGALCRPR